MIERRVVELWRYDGILPMTSGATYFLGPPNRHDNRTTPLSENWFVFPTYGAEHCKIVMTGRIKALGDALLPVGGTVPPNDDIQGEADDVRLLLLGLPFLSRRFPLLRQTNMRANMATTGISGLHGFPPGSAHPLQWYKQHHDSSAGAGDSAADATGQTAGQTNMVAFGSNQHRRGFWANIGGAGDRLNNTTQAITNEICGFQGWVGERTAFTTLSGTVNSQHRPPFIIGTEQIEMCVSHAPLLAGGLPATTLDWQGEMVALLYRNVRRPTGDPNWFTGDDMIGAKTPFGRDAPMPA